MIGLALTDSPRKEFTLPTTTIETSYRIAEKNFLDSLPNLLPQGGISLKTTRPNDLPTNPATANMRQILSKTPGIMIWENEGSGQQINISSRGLSPNRSWDFNVRQNGMDIAADPVGYPEAYYTPPMEAVEKIQILRGGNSLAFGPQIGGAVNFNMKGFESLRGKNGESITTVGGYGLVASYLKYGVKLGKVTFFTSYHQKQNNGWRQNAQVNSKTVYSELKIPISQSLQLNFYHTYSTNDQQQPGGLNDSLYHLDPKKSFRAANYLKIEWHLPQLELKYQNKKTSLQWNSFATFGSRISTAFQTSPILPNGTLNPDQWNNRTTDQDMYRNLAHEFRGKTQRKSSTILYGFRWGNTHLHRQTSPNSSSENSKTFSLDLNRLSRDLNFSSSNLAAYVSAVISYQSWSFIPALRWEGLTAIGSGKASATKNIDFQQSIPSTLLPGFAIEKKGKTTTAFANYFRSYRPVLFSDRFATDSKTVVDSNLKNGIGEQMEVGFRGKIRDRFLFEILAYRLSYQNRVTTSTIDYLGQVVQFRTNGGSSQHQGVEYYGEWVAIAHPKFGLSFSQTGAYNFSTYTSGPFAGKQVEYAPKWLIRSSLEAKMGAHALLLQHQFVDQSFSNAANTPFQIDGIQGKIPAYRVMDFSYAYDWGSGKIFAGVTNLLNEVYFTRRAGGLPGPGILPADSRNVYVGTRLTF
jgi:Fe(3+) dicitrate transport protein